MKISLMKLAVAWRRFRRDGQGGRGSHGRTAKAARERSLMLHRLALERLMQRANPFSPWGERANWLIDVADWLRRGLDAEMRADASAPDPAASLRARQRRVAFLLDWLDSHRDLRRVVRTTVQKTLREAIGPELFCETGLPQEPGMFRAFGERMRKILLPDSSLRPDMSALFTAMFPRPDDAGWLTALDQRTLHRLMRLCADDGIAHGYRKQLDEALVYLASMVAAVGIGPEFRQRLDPGMALQATPFMSLRREIEKYVLMPLGDGATLRSVRMLVAVCQAQTDRIYAHLDEHGVSMGLVYRVERMRAQLQRMGRLIDARAAPLEQPGSAGIQALLSDIAQAHHAHALSRGVVRRSFALLARKIVERHAARDERHAAHDRAQYAGMFSAGWRGGLLLAIAVLGKQAWNGGARFFDGTLAAAGFSLSFGMIWAAGGLLAGQQPAVTTPVLAAHLRALDNMAAMRRLLAECAAILRGHAAAMLGNLLGVVLAALVLAGGLWLAASRVMLPPATAQAALADMAQVGPTLVFGAATGVMLWFAGILGGFADNWFALRRMKDALAHHRHLVRLLGAPRAQRWAERLERHAASGAGMVSLALMFGLVPALAGFFGLRFEIRHAALVAGRLASAAASLGPDVFHEADFWLAVVNVLLAGALNVGVALTCALVLAMHARGLPMRARRMVFAALVRRVAFAGSTYLPPPREKAPIPQPQVPPPGAVPPDDENARRRAGTR
ncbi:site-specific recombinase [Noviherbaspirillum galbum]|uniref:Site-specific recombinase n=1 Tax=Noviherbaspirillum galbum TaxID=2709383 RepID=A0A6B3SK75_9BURK|nr:site-specific recombinase [Noviherbaspirillum galbum]NEX61183.1 site-specific recombinase [Noviherbaspirillum galbum]